MLRPQRGVAVRGAVIVAFLVIVMFVLPAVTGSDWVKTFTSVAIYSVVALGLGVLYGRVGMISLGQIGLLAIGTWTATRLNYATTFHFRCCSSPPGRSPARSGCWSDCRLCACRASTWR